MTPYTYQFLVQHNQLVPLEVQASSVEEACHLVKKISCMDSEIKGLCTESDCQEEWLLMRTTPYEYCNALHIYSWNGEYYKTIGKTPIGNDICSAIQEIAPDFLIRLAANENIKNFVVPSQL